MGNKRKLETTSIEKVKARFVKGKYLTDEAYQTALKAAAEADRNIKKWIKKVKKEWEP